MTVIKMSLRAHTLIFPTLGMSDYIVFTHTHLNVSHEIYFFLKDKL